MVSVDRFKQLMVQGIEVWRRNGRKSEKRVLQRSMSDEKGAAVALLQEKLDTQSRAAEELGGTLASLRGAHEAAKAQVARQQAARLVWKGRLPCLRTAHLRPHRTI